MGLGGIVGAISSIGAGRRARKMQRRGEALMKKAWKKRTDYQVPQGVQDNVSQAENELGGKSYVQQAMENSADQTAANNLSAVRRYATSSADALTAAAGVNSSQQQMYTQAAVAGAGERQQKVQHVYGARNTLADYKTLQWDMNVNQPFLQRMQFAQDMIGAGMRGRDAANQGLVNAAQSFDDEAWKGASLFTGMFGGLMGGGK